MCWFRHQTRIVTDTDGRIECIRCGKVLERWKLLRPEKPVSSEDQP